MDYDAHIHIALDGNNYKRMSEVHAEGPDEGHVRRILHAYKDAGITFLRDGGDKWGVSRLASALAPEYGIDYRTPVFAIHKKECYGSILGLAFETVDDFKMLVERAASDGCDFIKIMGSGIMDFDEYEKISPCYIEKDEMAELVKICHDRGLAVMVHCNGTPQIASAVSAGADSIEHGFYMEGEILHMMKEAATIWIPTLVPVAALAGLSGFNGEVMGRILSIHKENINKACDLGVNLGAGSDAGSYRVGHVHGIRKEYRLLEEAVEEKEKLERILQNTSKLLKDRFKRA